MSLAAVAAITALVSGGLTAVLIAILHVIEPEYDPSWRMISEYSLGRYGWLMRVAFVAMAVCPAAICVALWPFGGAWTAGLAIVALGPLGAVLIDTDPITTPRGGSTAVGRVHTVLGGLCIIGFPIAAVLAGVGTVPELGWTLAIASALPCAGVAWFLSVARGFATTNGGSPAVRIGWPNRVCLLAYLAWTALAATLVLIQG